MSQPNIVRINAAFKQVIQRLAPEVMAETQSNAELIANWVRNRPGKSLENLDDILAAIQQLHGLELIVWTVPPTEPAPPTAAQIKADQQEEVRKKLLKQIQRDAVNAAKNREGRRPEQLKQTQADAETAKIITQIEHFVNNYSVNGRPGMTDGSKSEAGRAYLATIQIDGADGKFSPALTLRCVKETRLPTCAARWSANSLTSTTRMEEGACKSSETSRATPTNGIPAPRQDAHQGRARRVAGSKSSAVPGNRALRHPGWQRQNHFQGPRFGQSD